MANDRNRNRNEKRNLETRQSMDRPQPGQGVRSEQRQINHEAFGRREGRRNRKQERRGQAGRME